MKVKIIRYIEEYDTTEFVALEDGVVKTSCGELPTFGIEELEDMKSYIKRGQHFMLSNAYIKKNPQLVIDGKVKP